MPTDGRGVNSNTRNSFQERYFGQLRLPVVSGDIVLLRNAIAFGPNNELYRGDGITMVKNLTPINGTGGGIGDMARAVYDVDSNGIVDSAERIDGIANSDIIDSINKKHTHINKVLLDSLISSGDGSLVLANDGTYKSFFGSNVHNNLTGRDAADCHPISAITDLSTTLTTINGSITTLTQNYNTINTLVTRNKGFYATEAALNAAHPTGSAGDYAIVGSTDTVWVWSITDNRWEDTGTNGSVTSVTTPDGTNQTGDVVLNLSQFEINVTSTQINNAVANSHTHANKTLLDSLLSNGTGTKALFDDGTYKNVTIDLSEYLTKSVYDADDDGIIDVAKEIDGIANSDIESAIDHDHTHSNKSVLDGIINTGGGTKALFNDGTYKDVNIGAIDLSGYMTKAEYDTDEDGVIDEATHAANADHADEADEATIADGIKNISTSDIVDAISKKHTHSNKAILDTITHMDYVPYDSEDGITLGNNLSAYRAKNANLTVVYTILGVDTNNKAYVGSASSEGLTLYSPFVPVYSNGSSINIPLALATQIRTYVLKKLDFVDYNSTTKKWSWQSNDKYSVMYGYLKLYINGITYFPESGANYSLLVTGGTAPYTYELSFFISNIIIQSSDSVFIEFYAEPVV